MNLAKAFDRSNKQFEAEAETMLTKPWQEVAQRAQAYRDASIAAITPPIPAIQADLPENVTHLPRVLLPAREIEITEMLPEELLRALASGKLSSVEVTSAFLRRAGLAQSTNDTAMGTLSTMQNKA